MKHISLKLFYSHSFKSIGKLASCKPNLVDLFIKLLLFAIFDKYVKDIGTMRLKDLQGLGKEPL
jgi:hypothetical protein